MVKEQKHPENSLISKLTNTGLMKSSHQKADPVTMINSRRKFATDYVTIRTTTTFSRLMNLIEILMRHVQHYIVKRALGISTISTEPNTTITQQETIPKVRSTRITLCTEKDTMRSIGTRKRTQSTTASLCG